MKANEYQELAMRTNDGKCGSRLVEWKEGYDDEIDCGGIINACLGLSGEVGELNDMIKKWIFHKSDIKVIPIQKEIGDICWYIAMICESLGFELEEIMQLNIEKLKARYPEGFDTERANNRQEGDE